MVLAISPFTIGTFPDPEEIVMKAMVATLADRALALIVPRAEAEAGCSYVWLSCNGGCTGGLRYRKRCMSGCSGVPNHCYPCSVTGTC